MGDQENIATPDVVTPNGIVIPPVVTPPVVEPKVDTKVVSKDLFDKASRELAEAKKLLKAKMSDDELKEAEKNDAKIKADEERKQIEDELNTLKKEVQTSKLISSTSEIRSKIEFGEDVEELKNAMEDLNFTTLSALINKLAETAYEKGKKEVTDGVMKKTGDLNLGGNVNTKINPELEEAKLIAKASASRVKENPYFTK